MKTYRNTLHEKGQSEYTNIAFCQADEAPNAAWVECSEDEIVGNHLYTQAGVRYFGSL